MCSVLYGQECKKEGHPFFPAEDLTAIMISNRLKMISPRLVDDYIFGIGDLSTGCMEIVDVHKIAERITCMIKTMYTDAFLRDDKKLVDEIFKVSRERGCWNTVVISSIDISHQCFREEDVAWAKNICLVAFNRSMSEELREFPAFRDCGEEDIPAKFVKVMAKKDAVRRYDFVEDIDR
jgi:hypothetical protein